MRQLHSNQNYKGENCIQFRSDLIPRRKFSIPVHNIISRGEEDILRVTTEYLKDRPMFCILTQKKSLFLRFGSPTLTIRNITGLISVKIF